MTAQPPATLPSGTLTFLFTDIEGSTARWEHQREAMAAALVRHDALVRGAIESHGGHVFKTVGDAFCAAFTGAADALAAALDAQRALAAEDWKVFGEAGDPAASEAGRHEGLPLLESEGFAPVRVRIGLHTGHADARGGDYFGPALNRTARLMAAGHGGQVLLSLATQQLVRDLLPEGVWLRDLGEHRLKDLRHGERLFQLLADGLPDVATAPVTADRARPADRIVVGEAGDERSLGDTLAALLAAVRDDEGGMTLTLPEIRQILASRPADLTEYRLGRIAEWSQPRYRLDGRFVALTLLVDQGEESASGRWAAKAERYEDLGALLAGVPDPALVVLGPPGSGKSTLLRHLELDAAVASLRGEDPRDTVTYFIQLNQYKPAEPGQPLPSPERWLAQRWAAAHPNLPSLEVLLDGGRMILLLDALNEMPASSEREFRERVGLWKDWLVQLAKDRSANHVAGSQEVVAAPELVGRRWSQVFLGGQDDFGHGVVGQHVGMGEALVGPLQDLGEANAGQDLDGKESLDPVLETEKGDGLARFEVDDLDAAGALPYALDERMPLKTAVSRTWERPMKASGPRKSPRVKPGR